MNVLRNYHASRILSQQRLINFVVPRRHSSNATAALAQKNAATVDETVLLQGSNSKSLGEIVRHGSGDACITLNVGGKEFYTLRSTVNANAVLADHVARAEANKEVTKNGAVFIDRDPEHFCFVLKHLRNRTELATAQHFDKASLTKFTKAYMELPKDPKVLRELYVEAAFYGIPELKCALAESSVTSYIASIFNKAGNPFDSVTKLLSQLRTTAALVAAGTVGGGTIFVAADEDNGTWMGTIQAYWDRTLQKVGLRERKEDGEAPGVVD